MEHSFNSSDNQLLDEFYRDDGKKDIQELLNSSKTKFQEDGRLLKIGGESKTKLSRAQITQITQLFSHNINFDPSNEQSNKIVNIYKNLLNDIKIYFNNEYNTFLKDHKINAYHDLV